MAKINSLDALFLEELQDTYNAEQQILKALPKMIKEVSSEELREAFEQHLEMTQRQVQRLERVFQAVGESPKGKRCAGMEGIIEEGNEHLNEKMDPFVKDAALLAAAQKVEHYEISTYGTLAAHAKTLGHDEALKLLIETLEEEKETDALLTRLAEAGINFEAADDEQMKGFDEDEGDRPMA